MQRRDEPSTEQRSIINNILSGNNVVINAKPGSGKTTTCVMTILSTNLNILVLTFSRHLYMEGRSKIEKLGFPDKKNSFFSIDGFAFRYYHQRTSGDIDFGRKSLDFSYDIIIIDEAQDLGEKHFRFIKKVLCDNKNKNPVLCVIGDVKQSIFECMDSVASDSRYLSLAPDIFPSKRQWVFLNLTQTFRLTIPMCDFVNDILLNDSNIRIRSIKESLFKPRYLKYMSSDDIANEIKYYINLGYTAEDIIVTAPSVEKNLIIKNLVNTLTLNHNIYLQNSDSNLRYETKYGNNKIKIMTYHACKGLESKVVIVVGFDSGLLYHATEEIVECPNTLFVASTRALEHVTFCHHANNLYLPFINSEILKYYVDFVGDFEVSPKAENTKAINQNVTALTKYISETHLKEIMSQFTITTLLSRGSDISLNDDVSDGLITENVSDINGTAVTALYEYFSTGNMEIYKQCILTLTQARHERYFANPDHLKLFTNKTPFIDSEDILKDLLIISTTYDAIVKGTFHRLKQIKRYDWISHETILRLIERLNKIKITTDGFEILLNGELNHKDKTYKLIGRADYIDERKIVEIKCKTTLHYEDFIQLMIYKYLSHTNKDCILYNIRTGEMLKVEASDDIIHDAIIKLMEYKTIGPKISDENFILKCRSMWIGN